jgi:hypothetical protein
MFIQILRKSSAVEAQLRLRSGGEGELVRRFPVVMSKGARPLRRGVALRLLKNGTRMNADWADVRGWRNTTDTQQNRIASFNYSLPSIRVHPPNPWKSASYSSRLSGSLTRGCWSAERHVVK